MLSFGKANINNQQVNYVYYTRLYSFYKNYNEAYNNLIGFDAYYAHIK